MGRKKTPNTRPMRDSLATRHPTALRVAYVGAFGAVLAAVLQGGSAILAARAEPAVKPDAAAGIRAEAGPSTTTLPDTSTFSVTREEIEELVVIVEMRAGEEEARYDSVAAKARAWASNVPVRSPEGSGSQAFRRAHPLSDDSVLVAAALTSVQAAKAEFRRLHEEHVRALRAGRLIAAEHLAWQIQRHLARTLGERGVGTVGFTGSWVLRELAFPRGDSLCVLTPPSPPACWHRTSNLKPPLIDEKREVPIDLPRKSGLMESLERAFRRLAGRSQPDVRPTITRPVVGSPQPRLEGYPGRAANERVRRLIEHQLPGSR